MLRQEFSWIVLGLISECLSSHLLPAADRTEVISESTSASFHSVHKRSLNEDKRHFVLRSLGEDRVLRLKRSDIFHPDFKAYYTERSEDGSVRIMEHQNFNKRDVGKIFSVVGESGSLLIPEDDDKQIEGILDTNHRIGPSAPKPNNTDSNTNDTHVVYKIKIPIVTSNDYVYPDPPPAASRVTERMSLGSVPDTVTVELLILFDSINCKKLDFNLIKIARYVGIFWNSVQARYANTSGPNIKFAIAGLLTLKSALDEPFIEANKFNATHVSESILPAIKEWLMNKKNLPNYDAAILHLGRDAGRVQNGVWKDSVAGLGYIGTACRTAEGYSIAFAEDQAPIFSGLITASHEMAHILNSPHDGTGDAKTCSGTNGNIMNAVEAANRNWQFSSCSLRIMKEFVRDSSKQCLWNAPVSQYPMINQYPAVMAGTLDEQCKRKYKDNTLIFRGAITPNICRYLWCGKKDSKTMMAHGGAVEGTMCDIRLVCIGGVCLSSNIPTLEQQCKDRFDGTYKAVNKYNSSVCQLLRCSFETIMKDLGPAKNGSMCGRAGTCKEGSCAGQTLSLDQQCKRNFGITFRYYVIDSRDVCTTLWCTENGSNLKSFGPADDYSKCGIGRLCQKKVCIPVDY